MVDRTALLQGEHVVSSVLLLLLSKTYISNRSLRDQNMRSNVIISTMSVSAENSGVFQSVYSRWQTRVHALILSNKTFRTRRDCGPMWSRKATKVVMKQIPSSPFLSAVHSKNVLFE